MRMRTMIAGAMQVYVCVCTVCVCECMCACMYVCGMYVCMYVCVYCMCVCVYVCMCVCVCVCVCVYPGSDTDLAIKKNGWDGVVRLAVMRLVVIYRFCHPNLGHAFGLKHVRDHRQHQRCVD